MHYTWETYRGSRGGAISENPPDPEYVDAFLQGARFALLALEGRLDDGDGVKPPELSDAIGDFHALIASRQAGVDDRETPRPPPRFLGKN